jgi:transposase
LLPENDHPPGSRFDASLCAHAIASVQVCSKSVWRDRDARANGRRSHPRFGVEGTGSYGAGIARFLIAAGCTVTEVNRPNRQTRYARGKSDPVDAEAAARAVLSGEATGLAKVDTDSIGRIRALGSPGARG